MFDMRVQRALGTIGFTGKQLCATDSTMSAFEGFADVGWTPLPLWAEAR